MANDVLNQKWRMIPGYLSSPKYDTTLIIGVMLLALLSGGIVLNQPSLFIVILFLDLWLLGYHHVIATFTKLAGTPEDRKENQFLIWYLPAVVLAATYCIYYFIGIWAIVTIYFFWQWYHYTRQSYGISVFYKKKSGINNSATPKHIELAVLWSVPIWGLLHRCAQDWDQFLFQDFWTPDVPMTLSVYFGYGVILLLSYWLISKIIDWKNGQLSLCHFGFLASHLIIFFVGYILIQDITIGWLVANVWHNAQYILFVWLFNKNRFRQKQDDLVPSQKKQGMVIAWLSQPKPYRILFYFGFCLLMTTVFYNAINLVLKQISAGDIALLTALTIVAYQTVNFHHYIVDSIIWKARKKSHQKIMNINT